MVNMIARLTLDKLGRIVIPKPVRDKLQLAVGDHLELECLDDRIVLRPLCGTGQLRKEYGVWVFHGGEPLSAATVRKTIEQMRRERDERNLGRSRLGHGIKVNAPSDHGALCLTSRDNEVAAHARSVKKNG
jgi:AbrB family looped-hinge helix DNA binding protein